MHFSASLHTIVPSRRRIQYDSDLLEYRFRHATDYECFGLPHHSQSPRDLGLAAQARLLDLVGGGGGEGENRDGGDERRLAESLRLLEGWKTRPLRPTSDGSQDFPSHDFDSEIKVHRASHLRVIRMLPTKPERGSLMAMTGTHASSPANPNTKLLYSKVAWNAINNAAGRADPVRCYPGTRQAVMAYIENWISGGDTSTCIFWLSGPAGAGKSAIAQSLADRCSARGIRTANFFFFRADSTRNHAAPLVATLLHQLFDIIPDMKNSVYDFITEHPYIFETSVEQQLKALMHSRLQNPDQSWPMEDKIVLILDGLDECSSESNSWVIQQDILRTLYDIVAQNDSPFILVVSSRAEPHLTRLFNGIQSHVGRLYLDGESFSPSDDIRLFVVGELENIKATHHLLTTLPAEWPSTNSIDAIVRKSSGHFIYAATVMRFVQISTDSPVLSLEKVEGIRPVENDSPFAQLDAVYLHILSKARNWPKTRDILAAQTLPDPQDGSRSVTLYNSVAQRRSTVLLDALGYNITEIASYTGELTALVKVEYQEIKFYHSSFGDFLLDERRSGNFYIDLDKFRLKLVPALFYAIGGVRDHLSWSLVLEHFTSLTAPTDLLTNALKSSSLLLSGLAFTGPTLRLFLIKIQELYAKTAEDDYKTILEGWLTWFHKNHGVLKDDHLDGIQGAGEIWHDLTQALATRSKPTKKKHSMASRGTPPSDSSSFSFMAESLISELLAAQIQSIKSEKLFDSFPEWGIAGASEPLYADMIPSIPLDMSSRRPGQLLPDYSEQPVHGMDSDNVNNQLDENFLPIDEALEDLKFGEGDSVKETHGQDIEVSRQRNDQHDSLPALSPHLFESPQPYHGEQMPQEPPQAQERLVEVDEHIQMSASQHFIHYLSNIFPANVKSHSPTSERREEIQPQPDVPDSIPQPYDVVQIRRAASPLVHAGVGVVNSSETQVLQDAYAQMIGSASASELFAIRTDAAAATADVIAVRAEMASARLTLEAAYAEAKSILENAKKEAESIRDETNKVARSGRIDVFTARDEYRRLMHKHDAVLGNVKTAQLQEEAARVKAASVREEIAVAQAELSNIRAEISNLAGWKFTPTQFCLYPGHVSAAEQGLIFL
ncbi:hypothetical protein D9619_013646 [Psilocybe cf. subviscida]|uniref:NACHT domain-containing protein n=1 Tax=Psilocybe cf. subviscida TaxID=2480587 RepID=A0A8H5BRA4_9AGAR|nr:hypothetical protein D9619_013646 [Psilocybe cf. subviscida]